MSFRDRTGKLLYVSLDYPIAPTIKKSSLSLGSLTVECGQVVVPYELVIVLSFENPDILKLILNERER